MARDDGDGFISSAGGAVAILGVILAMSGEADADPGDGDDPPDNGGGDPDPNENPTSGYTAEIVNDKLQATADASDPDGSIVGYDWELQGPGSMQVQKTGESVSFTLQQAATYGLWLDVTDDDGATDGYYEEFVYEGDSDPQNEPPVVEWANMEVEVSGDIVSGYVSGATDPDGSIVDRTWTLEYDGQVVNENSGNECLFTLGDTGTYILRITVTDDDGATDNAIDQFVYEGDDNGGGSPGNGDDNEAPSVSVSGFTVNNDAGTVDASASGSDPDGSVVSYAWDLDRDGTIVDTATGQSVTMSMSGSGTYTLRVEGTDDEGATDTGTYSFTYEEPGGGDPGNGDDRYYDTIERTPGSAETARISVFQTDALYNNCGRSPEYTVANALAGAFEHMGYDVVVKHGMPPLPSETEASGCNSDAGYSSGALGWFEEYVGDGNVPDEYLSKDSNIMLVDELGGGCGQSNGGDYCIAGANRFDSYFEWSPTMEMVPKERPGNQPNPRVQTLNHCMHEVGHNFNMGHGCGVIDRHDETETVFVPLNHSGPGGENPCEEVNDDRPDEYTWYLRAHWGESCCLQQLSIADE